MYFIWYIQLYYVHLYIYIYIIISKIVGRVLLCGVEHCSLRQNCSATKVRRPIHRDTRTKRTDRNANI